MSTYRLEIKWGILFTLITLAWMFIEKSMGWHGPRIADHPTYTNLFAIIAISVYVIALIEKRQSLGGVMSWKQGFISGVIITVVVALLSPLAQWLTHSIISPEYFPNIIAYTVESGKATQEEAESYFNLNSYLMQSFVGAILMGLITSAVVALFVRKKA